MPDLTEEISAFCKEAPDAEQEKPMAVLRYIARRHRLFFTYAVIILLVKHLAALLLNLVCYWLDSRGYRRFTRAVEAGFRMALVQKLQLLSMSFHSSMQSGAVLSKLISDVQFIQMLIYDRFIEVLYLCEDIVFIIVVAMKTFPLMLAFYIVVVPAAVLVLRRFSGPLRDSRAQMRRQNESAMCSGCLIRCR